MDNTPSVKGALHFEESVVDAFAGDFNRRLEQPISWPVFVVVAVAVVAAVIAAVSRTAALAVVSGDFYRQRALANINRPITVPAQRGLIADRFQSPLLKNIPSFTLTLNLPLLFQRRFDSLSRRQALERVARLVGRILPLEAPELVQRLAAVDWETTSTVVLARNLTLDQAINLKTFEEPGLEVGDDYRRQYADGPAFAHIIGYTGSGGADGQVNGVSGLESYYDNFLRGQPGESLAVRDASGAELDRKIVRAAQSGYRLETTIDAEFQKYFYRRLREGLAVLGRSAGAGLAIDPRNGEVLALVSLPSFDNNNPVPFLKADGNPLFNRAVSGAYNPGSTVKPLVALAALREKAVTPQWETYSSGAIELPNQYDVEHPSRFLDWRAHGWVNLRAALARSSNVFFYVVGGGCPARATCQSRPVTHPKGLGVSGLRRYWQTFGLDRLTGIDLEGEAVGFLPEPEEKQQRTGQPWRIGDTYNVSIGQGDLTMTPLRLLSFIASVANGGKMYRPFLAKKVVAEDGSIVQENAPEELLDYHDWAEEIGEVQEGMRDAVAQPYGTANKLYDLSYQTAGKTGSAQIANNTKTNAFFVGYGPYRDPQIAILVLVEDAKEGSLNAIPIAKDVLNWYYAHRL